MKNRSVYLAKLARRKRFQNSRLTVAVATELALRFVTLNESDCKDGGMIMLFITHISNGIS